MRDNDIIFLNLHRRYINSVSNHGGFLGIYCLSAFLNNNGYSAQSFAGQLMEGKKIIDELCQAKKVSMIGLYCDYENITENEFLSRYITETYNLPVIVGGPQATAFDEDFFKKSKCKAAVRYEGEITVLELVQFYLDGVGSLKEIKGISYLIDNKVVINPEQDLIENLDRLPFINEECYLKENRKKDELGVMTGRGCPFHCSFCHEGHHTRKVRFRSVENVLAEIELFLNMNPYVKHPYILFTDDTFTLIPERVKQLCEGIKKLRSKREFNWFCEGHIHTLYTHPEMISYIAEAGAERIQLGIEAGTQDVLDAYRKGSTVDEIRYVVKACEEAGINQIYSNIILGGAFFTEAVFYKDLNFAKELLEIGKGSCELGVVSFWPLAETSITNSPESYNIKITDNKFVTSVGDYPQTETDDISRERIIELMEIMESELNSKMKEMILTRKIPKEKILGWIPKKNMIKSAGRWWFCLYELKAAWAYYDMISKGEGFSYEDVEFETFESLHPMRTIPLQKYLKFRDGNKITLLEKELTDIEQDVLIYSTGKLDVSEIVCELQGKYSNIADDIKNILKKLERDFFIVFSKY